MKLSIVVPCLNLWKKFTWPCLTSIRASHDCRIVLVDNGSTDETPEEALRLVGSRFHYCRWEANGGTARSWNYGISDGFDKGADYVAVLNNDILLHPNCLDRLVERMGRNDLALVTALDIHGAVTLPGDVLRIPPGTTLHVPESEHPNFSAFLLSRQCWELVGAFDEQFYPAYFEDNDYHYRIQLAGLRAVVYPPAMFYHFGSRTQHEAYRNPIVPGNLFERNRRYYVLKWGGPPGHEQFRAPFASRHDCWRVGRG